MRSPRPFASQFGVATMVALLASCAQPVWYQPPTDAFNAATLVGSKHPQLPLIPDERAFVVAVDGAPVRAQAYGWDMPLALAPGPHTVQIGYSWSNDSGQVPLRIDLPPGARYVVTFEPPKGGFTKMWLADEATGAPVTEPYVVPINGGATTFVPVFVHRGK